MPGFFTWIAEGLGFGSAEAAGVEARHAELEAEREREAGLERRPETYYGTSSPVRDRTTGSEINPATGRPYDRTVGGTTARADDGFGWSWLDRTWRQITGSTTTVAGRDNETGGEVIATAEDRRTRTISPAGTYADEHVAGTRAEVLDTRAMAGEARTLLTDRRTRKSDERMRVIDQLAELERERAGAPAERHAELDRRRGELTAQRTRLDTEITRLDADLGVLGGDVDEAALLRVTRGYGLEVRPQYTTSTEQRTTSRTQVGIEGVGLAGSRSTETVDTAGGRTTTTTSTRSGSVDLLAGSGSYGTSDTEATRANDLTRTVSHGSSTSVAARDGTLTGTRSRSGSVSETDADGNVIQGVSGSSSSSVGMIANDDELGVAYGRSESSSETAFGRTSARTDTSSTRVTDRGVARTSSTDRSVSSSHTADGTTSTWRGGARTSRSGSFTIDVEPIEGSVPPQYRITMALSAGAGVTLSGSAGRATEADAASGRSASGASGSVSGGASGSVGLTYRHVMGEAEARQYMLEADRAEDTGAAGSRPEFGLVSRLRALLANGDDAAAGGLAVLGSSQAAAGLGDGESIELTLTGTISGEASVSGNRGAFGGSVEAGGSMSMTRRVRVAHVGDNLVEVTITFIEASSHRAGGSVTIEGVTGGGRITGSERDSEAATARLRVDSPTYAADYHTLCAATSIDEVRSLASSFTTAHTETSGGEGTVGVAGVTMTMGRSSTMSSEITRTGETGLTGEFSGGVTDSASISAADTSFLQASDRHTAVGTVDAQGLDVRLEHEESSSDIGRSISEGWTSLTTWARGDHDAADVARAVATSPQERLRRELERTYSRLEEYSLSEPDIDVLVGRARDQRGWSSCIHTHRRIREWESLRGALISPSPDAEWTAINVENANRLARARSLAEFMRLSGSDGTEAMEHCLRRWGERGFSESTAPDLGVFREWPNSILRERTKLLTARSRIRGADEHLVGLIGRGDGLSRARAWHDDTLTKLREVETAVANCRNFEHPRAKLEMLDEIARLRLELEAAWQRNLHALETGVAESGLSAAEAPPDGRALMSHATDADRSVDPSPAPPPNREQAADRARMSALVGIFATSKSEESALFARARGMIRAELGVGGTIVGTWGYLRNGNETQAVLLMSEVIELHEAWVPRIVELRAVYERLGTPRDQWVVSTGPGAPRNTRYEPDVETMCQIYALDYGSMTSSLSLWDRRARAGRYRARGRAY